MWRESIGSAIGVVHAHRAGRPVAIADPNYIDNLILSFYADIVEDNPLKAAGALLKLLKAGANWKVRKSDDREDEQFDRRKLMTAIRAACRAAERDDLIVPRLVLKEVLEYLESSDRKVDEHFSSGDINKGVIASLEKLEAIPEYSQAVKGVAEQWQIHREKNSSRGESEHFQPSSQISPASSIHVKISCGKSHATIWGKTVNRLDDIPSTDARTVFRTITAVPGITEISLRHFNNKDKRSSCGAVVSESTTSNIIEGKLFDKGQKGTLQTFQVRIQDDSSKKTILNNIIDELEKINRWAE